MEKGTKPRKTIENPIEDRGKAILKSLENPIEAPPQLTEPSQQQTAGGGFAR